MPAGSPSKETSAISVMSTPARSAIEKSIASSISSMLSPLGWLVQDETFRPVSLALRVRQGQQPLAPKQKLLVAQKLSLIHISEPTRLLSISYAVFCLKK